MINLKDLHEIKNILDTTNLNIEKNLFLEVDNRQICKESLFIAIVGAKYNPLSNIKKVIESGCEYVAYESNNENNELISSHKEKINFIPVDSIIDFVQSVGQAIATSFRSRGGKIIGISGSNGKTTTKEMMYHLLDGIEPNQVICTQKNNNNHLGVPFTLFQIKENTKYAIVELGSNHPGEIEHLCKIVEPQYGVTTNIGDTHLEFFKNRENVFKEESCLASYASEIFFQNIDDEFLCTLKSSNIIKTYGVNGKDYKFIAENSKIQINDLRLTNTDLTGRHNFINLGVAFIICDSILDTSTEKLISLACCFKPTSNRSEWIEKDDKHYFLDAYNANPSSMRVAVDGFLDRAQENNVLDSEICMILGDMNELGENTSIYHKEIGDFVLEKEKGTTIFIGDFSDDYAADGKLNTYKFNNVDAMMPYFKNLTNNIKYCFIKGSRSLQLERILDIK
jgi:UDP-N-acetylmuramoyl-tripeptide--D-alanyl-D-alanine ligase